MASVSPAWSTGSAALLTSPTVLGLLTVVSSEQKPQLPSASQLLEREDIPRSPLPPVEAWSTGAYATWTSPTVLDLLPHLSAEEKVRLQLQGRLPEGNTNNIYWSPSYAVSCGRKDDASIISTVCDVLDHYNARHPGGEFDVVKPLLRDSLRFRGQVWLHMNFWARSRSSKRIKRFFAEVHYKPSLCSDPSFPGLCTTIVESCSIIEEPLTQYKRSCAFCSSYLDILHPMDDREFVCGNGNAKDWMVEKRLGMRFISRCDPVLTPTVKKEERSCGDPADPQQSRRKRGAAVILLTPRVKKKERSRCDPADPKSQEREELL